MKITLRQEGEKVLINFDDRTYLELAWQSAMELAQALKAQALKAQAYAEAERIIYESAMLIRSGAPFTLSDDPSIRAEAAKEAAWNRELRRAMPGGVKSGEVFGVPKILQSKKRH